MTPTRAPGEPPVTAEYVAALGDDALIASHRLAQWITRAPQLEEDVALANIALDLLGHARVLLAHAGELEGAGRDEDDLAYLRDERQFGNCRLLEPPDEDFGYLIARLLLLSSYQCELYQALTAVADPQVAALAGKAVKETRYHRDHAEQWTVRLGDGTEESHRRMTAALTATWPYTGELFDTWPAAESAGVDPASWRPAWLARVGEVLAAATLTVPEVIQDVGGGRAGVHTEHLGYLLAEMQYLHRSHPGATW